MKKYRDLERNNLEMCKDIRRLQNKLVNVEVADRNNKRQIKKLQKILYSVGFNEQDINNGLLESESNDDSITNNVYQKGSRQVYNYTSRSQ